MSSSARANDRIPAGALVHDSVRGRVDVRTAGSMVLACLLVFPLGLTDGGFFGRSITALTVALGAGAVLAMLELERAWPSRALMLTALGLALLASWIALSSLWARGGSAVELEVRRSVLYVSALVAVGVVVDVRRRRAFLLALVAGVATLAVVGVAMRVVSGEPVDPYYGSLFAEPVGYPNAIGVLVAIAAVLAIGLAGEGATGAERILRGLGPFFVLVLGLSGSRGGALALAVGLLVLVGLSERSKRWHDVGMAASAVAIGGGAWGVTVAAGGEGAPLVIAAAGAMVAGAAIPTPGRRGTLVLLCGLAVAAAVAIAVQPPSTSSSFRSAYWQAALAEVRERPLLGSGAGSFFLSWQEHRSVETYVRDAHSLYIETLSELGPVGLALVLAVVAVPLAAAVRRRGDPLVATAAAGFAVFAFHAGIDWDWEMPVVTLVALGCGGTVLAVRGEPTSRRRTR